MSSIESARWRINRDIEISVHCAGCWHEHQLSALGETTECPCNDGHSWYLELDVRETVP